MNQFTTLNNLLGWHPCKHGWATLLRNLNKTTADSEPLSFATILESNGLEDAIWALRTSPSDYETMMLSCAIVRTIIPLTHDVRLTQAADVLSKYATGEVSREDLYRAVHPLRDVFPFGGISREYFAARMIRGAAEPGISTGIFQVIVNARSCVYAMDTRMGEKWEDSPEHKAIRQEFVARFCSP